MPTLEWLMQKLGTDVLSVAGAEAVEPVMWDEDGKIIHD